MRTLLYASLFAGSLLAQLPTAPVNLDFESGETGKVPAGWTFGGSPAAAGAAASTVDAGCYEGARCAVLKGADDPPSNWFGTLTQGVDASAYRIRRIRFRAAVRVEGAGTNAQLWLRVDRRTGGYSFFDNMSARPITSAA
ncbi:MAG: hypothetical protein HY822_20790 [Acidobacteria bacterium]|nr:hypothetical protein [Acidobacteriota bacterium]